MRSLKILGLSLACSAAVLLLARLAKFVLPEWRTIQVLQTQSGDHRAELQRLYGYIDVNFRILLDGKRIHVSPDFAPTKSRPFREWISWDEKEKYLVFIVADEILFLYDLQTRKQVPEITASEISIPRYTLRDLRYEGQHGE